VEIVERQKAIELMEAEVHRRVNELEAEVIEPAKSEARKIEALADARKEELAAQGAGEADAVRLRGMAEAEAMMAKARAWGEYNEAAIADRLLSILPQLAAAVAEPLSKTEKIVMIGGNGDGVGAHRVTRDVMQIVAELPEVLESLTGKRLDDLVKALPKTGGNGGAEVG
jgi:flotillin